MTKRQLTKTLQRLTLHAGQVEAGKDSASEIRRLVNDLRGCANAAVIAEAAGLKEQTVRAMWSRNGK